MAERKENGTKLMNECERLATLISVSATRLLLDLDYSMTFQFLQQKLRKHKKKNVSRIERLLKTVFVMSRL